MASVRSVIAKGAAAAGEAVAVRGWLRTARHQKKVSFLAVNDGSTARNVQVVLDADRGADVAQMQTGASVLVRGTIQPSPGRQQTVEIHADDVQVIGPADPETYPLQKKRQTLDFLRRNVGLRARTETFANVARVRSTAALAVHRLLSEDGFHLIHTPVITSLDAEGAGSVFSVRAADDDGAAAQTPSAGGESDAPAAPSGYFGTEQDAFLTVSGQLHAECLATALGRVYTFGPTFRAERSFGSRHLAEFWMVEPEMAWATLDDAVDSAERLIRGTCRTVLDELPAEMGSFERLMDADVRQMAERCAASEGGFARMTYTEAVDVLAAAVASGKADFAYAPQWGHDLQTEHERFLTDVHAGGAAVVVTDYPAAIKPFYMYVNETCSDARGETVACMDILLPRVGEVVGGSQREDRLDVLLSRMDEDQRRTLDWYVDLRRFGNVPHAGYGLGFERLLAFITGVRNVRDVVAFPRSAGACPM